MPNAAPNTAYVLDMPTDRTSCVVFASPHSGRTYPDSLLQRSVLNRDMIRSSEDAYVDQLFASVAEFGAPLLAAAMPRAYLDLNRSSDELDPALIQGARRHGHNPRVSSGLGVIPRVVANGRAIYSGKLTMDEARLRIDTYWRPYHARLKSLLAESHEMFGQAILVDCHSMPHEAVAMAGGSRSARPEIVLGDRFGAAASGVIVDQIEAAFTNAGLQVARNAPFAGAYVTQTYGRPTRHQHAIQIEIDRSLYMDEETIQPNGNFQALRDLLRRVTAQIAGIGADPMSLAAE
ncbi:N-formylglutamate amidohydrolase [Ruegeria sp. ANG-R]|uniref:N-formylglutamate amidohydrolase n=1 Tax=Ruegeria sp. ANG-R TaxID=1577903 RepID=UPI00057DC2AE|nr:N-formylglutamate amidohydrolase [Ruegeria sp. ANG-R]KIC38227.1 N-formylglutamate amidohydrolase [Ruegeria sp. ANG-R]